jgi:hypothetical protein
VPKAEKDRSYDLHNMTLAQDGQFYQCFYPYYYYYYYYYLILGARGSVVVKALCYKLEGREIDTTWGESEQNRNEYQKHKNNHVSGE